MAVAEKNGHWYIVLSTGERTAKGNYKYKWIPTNAQTKTQAKKEERKYRDKQDKGLSPYTKTVKEFLEEWMTNYVKSEVDPLALSTQEWYQDNIDNYINPVIGHIKLCQLKVLDCEKVLQECAKTVKEKKATKAVIRGVRATMSSAFGTAVEWKIMDENLMIHVKKPPKEKHEIPTLDLAESDKLIEFAKTDYYSGVIITAALTGLRIDEVCGLRTFDLDLENGQAHVEQQVVKCGKNPIFGPLKNKKDYIIPLAPRLIPILQHALERREAMKEKALKKGRWTEYNLVFPNRYGGPVDSGNISARNFKQILLDAKLPTMKLHALRHSFVTNLLEIGTPLKAASLLVNHSDEYFTDRTYGHPKAKTHGAFVNKLDEAITQAAAAAEDQKKSEDTVS